MSTRQIALVSLAALLITFSGSLACEWDRDTRAMEASNKFTDQMDVIVGKFNRNPPLYYEMRLRRVSAELEKEPENLDLYDDAGVACDRLGRGDEAIAWMAKKKLHLDKLDQDANATKEHRYRYLANLGTFYAHRWIHSGASRDKMDDVRLARTFIADAIKLNPDAHFGREKNPAHGDRVVHRSAENRGREILVVYRKKQV